MPKFKVHISGSGSQYLRRKSASYTMRLITVRSSFNGAINCYDSQVKLKRKLGDIFDWNKLTQYQELVDDVPGSENAPLAEAVPFAEDVLLAKDIPFAVNGPLAEDATAADDPSSNDNGIRSGGDVLAVNLDDEEMINEVHNLTSK